MQIKPEETMKELVDLQRKVVAAAERLSRIRDGAVEIATTPKEEVLRIDKTVLYRYVPLVETVSPIPVLIAYALVGRYTMIDLQDDRSFVRHLLKAGLDVYVVDWGVPTRADRFIAIDDYVNDYLGGCVEEICRRHGIDAINLLGICQGGVFSLCYTALHPERIRNLVTTVTPVDFHADKEDDRLDRGFMNVWARSMDGRDIDRMVDTLGNVPGDFTGNLFSMMTPGRSLTKYNFDLLDAAGDDGKLLNFLRMEKWLADRPDHTGEAARQWLKDLYQENKLVRGEFVLDGRRVELANIRAPVLNIFTDTDHIIPPAMSRALKDHVGSADYTEIVVKGGHIGAFVGLRTHAELASTIEGWLAGR
jgi:poly[(R)-3-hydroxyalkanoate] polymerase subunit PhaC